ncbi:MULTISPECIES: hypothetical protein [Flavobacterium]|uniref:Uncharacterized protein n=1 Tax=Flavobacterium keumense TaxID=1306518 RepID=A0ABY8N2E7_9FLAO|nr:MULTISPECIES: hypothetical protein [Flavobacterium]WGK93825.1 hypothetical protein MG292_06900 [Flavobacterium keumense]
MEELLIPLIDAEILHDIIQEEKNALQKATTPERKKALKKRIHEAREMNKKYLTFLN